jgi:hypothetical protein
MNTAQKKQLTDEARRDTLDEIEKRAEGVVKKHRGSNPMADYGATEVLMAVRNLRREWGLEK